MGWLNVLGLILQLVGVGVTAWGLARTWHEYVPGRSFWSPWLDPLRPVVLRLTFRLEGALRRVLHRPQNVTAHAEMAAALALGGRVRARVRWGPLPTDLADAVAELDRRTRQLSEGQADAADSHADDVEDLRRADADLYRHLGGAVERLEQQDRRVATGGVQLAAFGLFVVMVGLVCQVVVAAAS